VSVAPEGAVDGGVGLDLGDQQWLDLDVVSRG